MRKVSVLGCVCCVLALWLVPSALATPYFTLESAGDFQNAISSGSVMPQTNPNGDPSLVEHYPSDAFMVAEIYPYTPSGEYAGIGDPDGGLIMQWGSSVDQEAYAQWLYSYTEDPNLVGMLIKGTVFAPFGIRSISFSIIDALGSSRSWDWNVTPPGGPGPIFNNVLTPFSIAVVGKGLGGPGDATPFANSYFDGGFAGLCDPTQIITLGYDENGNWVRFIQASPTGGAGPWNYFGRIETTIIPEPSTLVLLCMAAFGLLLHVSRRRK